MAKKQGKKTRHTKLVLPGDNKDTKLTKEEKQALKNMKSPENTPQQIKRSMDVSGSDLSYEMPPNAIIMPDQRSAKKSMRAPAVLSKRRKRRMRMIGAGLMILAVALAYLSGLYMFAAGRITDVYDSMRLTLQPGQGFPMKFTIKGYLKAEPVGKTAYALLGEKDMAVVSSSGRELYRIQHGYVNPGLASGDTRIVVFSRGGTDYSVESRTKTLTKGETEQEILFADMSPGGWLAVVTSSRYRSNLMIYDPLYGPDWTMIFKLVDEKPILTAFKDDKTLALGCLSAKDGVLGSTIFILRTNSDKPTATIREPYARLLKAGYAGGNLIAIYDTHTAVYDSEGRSLAQYDYNGQSIETADINADSVALVFGTGSQEEIRLAVLDAALKEKFSVVKQDSPFTRVLAAPGGAYLLSGQDVLGYNNEGKLINSLELTTKPLGLSHGYPEIAVAAGKIHSITKVLDKNADLSTTSQPVSGSLPASSSGTAPKSEAAVSTAVSDTKTVQDSELEASAKSGQ